MKKVVIALLVCAGWISSGFGYTFTVHNNTDTPMEVRLVEALSSDVRKTVAPFITEKIHTTHDGTCTREIMVTGIAANDGKDTQRTALGLEAKHKFSGEFGVCSGKEIFINYVAPAPAVGGVNVTVDMAGSQAAQSVAGRGSLTIEAQ